MAVVKTPVEKSPFADQYKEFDVKKALHLATSGTGADSMIVLSEGTLPDQDGSRFCIGYNPSTQKVSLTVQVRKADNAEWELYDIEGGTPTRIAFNGTVIS